MRNKKISASCRGRCLYIRTVIYFGIEHCRRRQGHVYSIKLLDNGPDSAIRESLNTKSSAHSISWEAVEQSRFLRHCRIATAIFSFLQQRLVSKSKTDGNRCTRFLPKTKPKKSHYITSTSTVVLAMMISLSMS